jgi:hypothetical protein
VGKNWSAPFDVSPLASARPIRIVWPRRGVVAVGVGILGGVSRQRHQRAEMCSCRIAHQRDTRRVDFQIDGLAAHPLYARTSLTAAGYWFLPSRVRR